MLATLNACNAAEAQKEKDEILQLVKLAEEIDHPELEAAYDDVSGALLDPEQVYKARLEEVEYIRGMKLYDEVPNDECWQVTGKAPRIHEVDRY